MQRSRVDTKSIRRAATVTLRGPSARDSRQGTSGERGYDGLSGSPSLLAGLIAEVRGLGLGAAIGTDAVLLGIPRIAGVEVGLKF